MVTKSSENKSDAQQDENQGKEIAKPAINWAKVETFMDAREVLANAGIVTLDAASVFGDGSTLIKDKDLLVGRPMLILEWRFIMDEKTKREYVNVLAMVVRPDGTHGKVRFNDGSTGIYKQLKQLTEENGGGFAAVECRGGLRKSDYTTPEGEAATTYYLSA